MSKIYTGNNDIASTMIENFDSVNRRTLNIGGVFRPSYRQTQSHARDAQRGRVIWRKSLSRFLNYVRMTTILCARKHSQRFWAVGKLDYVENGKLNASHLRQFLVNKRPKLT